MSAQENSGSNPDIALISLQQGDEEAFGKLVSDNWDKIFNRANSLLNNYQDAEEVAQDTFLRARKSISTFRGDCSLSTWLYHIATNLARNKHWYWWRRKRGSSISLDAPVSEEGSAKISDMVECSMPNPRECALSAEFEDMLPRAIAKMPEKYAEVFKLRAISFLSYEQIAADLDVSVGTVKSRLSRAREFLREELSKDEY